MIALSWRQSRTQVLVAAAALAVLALLTAVTGPHLAQLYDATVAVCGQHHDCDPARKALLLNDAGLRTWLGLLVVVVPGVVGIFWGAPMVARELEAGTFRLAWTQSVTRTRWLSIKLGVVGLAVVAVAGVASLAVSWWAAPLDRAGRDQFATFDARGIVPLGHAAFAFALGVTAGVLMRRTLPAMATTMVAFIAARLAFAHLVRPHLLSPTVRAIALDPHSTGYGTMGSLFSSGGPATLMPNPPDLPNAWLISSRIVDQGGHALTSTVLKADCPSIGSAPPPGTAGGHGPAPAGVQQALQDCVAQVGATYHQAVTYQPAGHYWPLQWCETAIFVAAAVALCGLSLWWVRRRLG